MSGWSLKEIGDSRHKFRRILRLMHNLVLFGNNPNFFLAYPQRKAIKTKLLEASDRIGSNLENRAVRANLKLEPLNLTFAIYF